MRIAVISPVPCLDLFATQSDYHLILCHHVTGKPGYGEFYNDRVKKGDFVILDNSAHELGEGETEDMLLEAYRKVEPTELILPDRLFFGDDTIEESTYMYHWLQGKISKSTKLMGVPQGRTDMEWRICCEHLLRLGVDTIGISKDYEVWTGGIFERIRIVKQMIKVYANKPVEIHLLGWGRQMDVLGPITGTFPDVRGIDSAKPLMFAAHGIALPLTLYPVPKYPRRLKGYFDFTQDKFDIPTALHNIKVFRFWATGGKE